MASDFDRDGPASSPFDKRSSSPPLEMEAPLGNPGSPGFHVNPEAVNKVMYSEVGINVLLNRLKQSIASGREFASFLNKRARLEEKHAQGLKEMSRATQEAVRRPDGRQGSYALQMADIARAHERMADHGIQFAASLSQMHNDLTELTANMERSRKHWKQEGLNSEKRVKDAEGLMDKAKARYDSLAEEYDRARTGDKSSGRVFTVKGPKSAEKHEEDLHRKLQAADSDYAAKVQSAASARQENLQTNRPQAVKAIQEHIRECDAALTLQLQKFAAFNERLVVGNGLEISPVKDSSGAGTTSGPPSMREMIQNIDNERDFQTFVTSHSSSVPHAPQEIKYRKHPLLGPTQQVPQPAQQPPSQAQAQRQSYSPTSPSSQPPSSFNNSQPPPSFSITQPPSSNSTAQPQQQPLQQRGPPQIQSPPQQGPGILSSSGPGYNYPPNRQGAPPDQGFRGPPSQQFAAPAMNGGYPPSGPPMNGQRPPQQGFSPSGPNGSLASRDLPPTKPIFGLSLDALFRRDDLAVPMVVIQCIQAVDLFGLEVEGIYRLSGNANHINQLRAVFDHDSSRVDFRNPESFHHDVNSVAGLLKQFFRDLPDPLFTSEHYNEFIEAARIDDDNTRRDSIHAVINALPDPNYATLRALVLHLNRVQEHAAANRMSTHNLAICFAPTIMGQHTGPLADAGLQARVVDTILQNTYQIFDED